MTSLLEQAKQIHVRRASKYNITDDHVELALAWLTGEISYSQLARAINQNQIPNGNNQMYRIAGWLREAFKQGKLVVKESNV